MSKPATSFQKKPRGVNKRVDIPGTKPSLHNNQLLISTGIPSFDFHVGGGVAVGTLLLIEEDLVGSFAHLMLRYFVAEGITSGQSLVLAGKECGDILNKIPEPISHDGGAGGDVSSTPAPKTSNNEPDMQQIKEDDLKIAWRYKDINKPQSNDSTTTDNNNKFGHYYDLNKTVDASVLDRVDKCVIDLNISGYSEVGVGDHESVKDDYERTLDECADYLEKGGHLVSSPTKPENRKICRIAVHSAGSPLWNSSDPFALTKFVFRLKHLLRQSFACAVVTIPSETLPTDNKIISSLRHLADYVVNLRSFAGTDDAENPALKDYHGLFHIIKLPRLNSLTRFTPSTFDLAFKLRRKRFTVEKLHLPPDLAETAEREQDETSQSKGKPTKKKTTPAVFGGGCGGMTGGSGALDF